MNRNSFFTFLFAVLPFCAFLQPVGYYNGTEGLQGNDLKMKLHEIIDGHNSLSYFFSKYVIYYADADPAFPGNVILIYTGRSQNGMDYGSGGNKINREHVWAKSHGQFEGILPMDSDVHNLKPADASVNTARSNLDFDWSLYYHSEATECKFTPGVSWEPRNAVKGDVARTIFYMDTRYEYTNGEANLTVVDKLDTYPYPEHGKLSALLEWNPLDPPDQFEYNRNNVIYRFQKNRNPFIDNPAFVELIWGQGSLPYFSIGGIGVSDDQPQSTQKVTVSASIEPKPEAGDVKLYWGDAFNNLQDHITMNFSNGKWLGEIPAFPEEKVIYFAVRAIEGNSNISWSPTYSYRVASSYNGDIISIPEIQGTGSNTPYENQIVTTTGIVTAFFPNGYYIQAGNGPRTGLFIYDPNRFPAIGDSIVITGLAKEYYGLTEMTNPTMYKLIKTDLPGPDPEVLTASDLGEDWESVLVRIADATCTYAQHWNNSGMWRVNDGTGQVNVHNNDVFEIDPVLNKDYTITGPLSYDYSEWKIELRSLKDISDPTFIGEKENLLHLIVFPNPTAGELFIQLPVTGSLNREIRIFDLMGIEKSAFSVDSFAETFSIDLRQQRLMDGIYFVVYSDDTARNSERIILLSD
ncbi:MAG: endonuclease [Bacteroidales bacterium]|nr:endonuclease [Bacteroidales bacterium]